MQRPHLDVDALYIALDQKRRNLGWSWRQVATAVGIAASTLSRMTQGKRPDVDSFAALVKWLRVPADTFLRGEIDGVASGAAISELSTHLRASKEMPEEKVDAFRDLLAAVERLMGPVKKSK